MGKLTIKSTVKLLYKQQTAISSYCRPCSFINSRDAIGTTNICGRLDKQEPACILLGDDNVLTLCWLSYRRMCSLINTDTTKLRTRI